MDEIVRDARRLLPGELEQLIDRLQAALDEAPRTEIEEAWGREVEQVALPAQSLFGVLRGRLHPQDPAVSEEDAISALLLEEDSRSRAPASG